MNIVKSCEIDVNLTRHILTLMSLPKAIAFISIWRTVITLTPEFEPLPLKEAGEFLHRYVKKN